jgi:hypothetical protein
MNTETIDPTETARRVLAVEIHALPAERADLGARYGRVWDTAELGREFEVVGFAAPFAVVRRKADDRLGSVLFQHWPRYYFSFVEDS